MLIRNSVTLKKALDKAINDVKIIDVHTHLFTSDFGELLLWGIDELLTYHYLIAETMRRVDISYDCLWKMTKKEQADLVWDTLFIKSSPISESCRGVLTVLEKMGIDASKRDLTAYRKYFESMTVEKYIDKVFEIAGIKSVVMTNDPFEDAERKVWMRNKREDQRFKAALRIDPLLNSWEESLERLKTWGYNVEEKPDEKSLKGIRKFLGDWIERMRAVYMAVSLPPDFKVADGSARSTIIEECVIPVCRQKSVPLAMMIGVKRFVNPRLRLAGDGIGKGNVDAVEYLCAKYPHNKFMVTMLSRENQHELCVAARKFRNLLPFGCWWFLNNPSLIDEITRMRFELLGTSVIPQHSDARILDQLIYKWSHSKEIISKVLFEKYSDILNTGWTINESETARDIEEIFGGYFERFIKR